MIRIVIILLISVRTFGQNYVVKFKTVGKEPNVINYQIQRSIDSINWSTIPGATIQPKKLKDSNLYSYTLPTFNISFFRVKALMSNTTSVYTKPEKKVYTNVSITSPILKINTTSDNLSFNASNELQVNYYLIERSNDGGTTWVIAGKLTQKFLGKYIVNVSKVGLNRRYRISAIYKSGIKSDYINFL